MARKVRFSATVPLATGALLTVLLLTLSNGSAQSVQGGSDDLPWLEVEKTVTSPNVPTVWIQGSGKEPQELEVTITVSPRGEPVRKIRPQDVALVLDESGSMEDPLNPNPQGEFQPAYKDELAYDSVNMYLSNLMEPDRGLLIFFNEDARIVGDHYFTTNYSQLSDELDQFSPLGQTNLRSALDRVNHAFETDGDPTHQSIAIILSDGAPTFSRPEHNVTTDQVNRTRELGVELYTIGLGNDHDARLLRWLAASTGGQYFFARESEDLERIYVGISELFINLTAGTPEEGVPMIKDVLPPHVHLVEDSFSIPPDRIIRTEDGGTILIWNGTTISFVNPGGGIDMKMSYRVTLSKVGDSVDLHRPGESRLHYMDVNGTSRTVSFDDLTAHVLYYAKGEAYVPVPPPPPSPPPPTLPYGGQPLLAPPPEMSTLIPQAPPVAGAMGAETALPYQYFVAGMMGLGLAERIRHRKVILTKHKIALRA